MHIRDRVSNGWLCYTFGDVEQLFSLQGLNLSQLSGFPIGSCIEIPAPSFLNNLKERKFDIVIFTFV